MWCCAYSVCWVMTLLTSTSASTDQLPLTCLCGRNSTLPGEMPALICHMYMLFAFDARNRKLAAPLMIVKSASSVTSVHDCPAPTSGLIHCAPCQSAACSSAISHHAGALHPEASPAASHTRTTQ